MCLQLASVSCQINRLKLLSLALVVVVEGWGLSIKFPSTSAQVVTSLKPLIPPAPVLMPPYAQPLAPQPSQDSVYAMGSFVPLRLTTLVFISLLPLSPPPPH